MNHRMISPLEAYSKGAQSLIVAAEKLVALRGVEGASVREILRKAGHANNSAVYHHFGSKEKLIVAAFNARQQQIDVIRKRRLEEAGEFPPTVAAIIELIMMPVIDTFRGERLGIFARFVLQLIIHDPQGESYARRNDPPIIHDINIRFRAALPELPDDVFFLRYAIATTYFLHGIVYALHVEKDGNPYLASDAYWRDLVRGASATMLADYRPDGTS